MIHNLFPTPIGFYELDRPVTAEELAFVKGLDKRPNMGNVTSVDNYLLSNSRELDRLHDFVLAKTKEYFQEVHAPKFEVQPYITQSWANYTDKGQYQIGRAHV